MLCHHGINPNTIDNMTLRKQVQKLVKAMRREDREDRENENEEYRPMPTAEQTEWANETANLVSELNAKN